MKAPISFRCAAKTDPGQLRTITVSWPGPKAVCTCDGFDGVICSHIDATLVAGERAMVPESDRGAADRAMRAIVGQISLPPHWKRSWRQNHGWRGLPTREFLRPRVGLSGKPIVCFTGAMPMPRKQLLREAEASGWETVDHPHSKTTVLVTADLDSESRKVRYARQNGIAVLAFEEWTSITADGELAET